MPGGLLQLISYGNQDKILISNPTISFFKNVYKKPTLFCLENIEVPLNSSIYKIKNYGDLLKSLNLKIELPTISFDFKKDILSIINDLNKTDYVNNIEAYYFSFSKLNLLKYIYITNKKPILFDEINLLDYINYDNSDSYNIFTINKKDNINDFLINNQLVYIPFVIISNFINNNSNFINYYNLFNIFISNLKYNVIKNDEIFTYDYILNTPIKQISQLNLSDVFTYIFNIDYIYYNNFIIIVIENNNKDNNYNIDNINIKAVLYITNYIDNNFNLLLYGTSFINDFNNIDINNDFLIYSNNLTDYYSKDAIPIYKCYINNNFFIFEIKGNFNEIKINKLLYVFSNNGSNSFYDYYVERSLEHFKYYPKCVYKIVNIDFQNNLTIIYTIEIEQKSFSNSDLIFIDNYNVIKINSIDKIMQNTDIAITYNNYINLYTNYSNLKAVLLSSFNNNWKYLLNFYKNVFNSNNYVIQLYEIFFDYGTNNYITPVYNKNTNVSIIINNVLQYLIDINRIDSFLYREKTDINYNFLYETIKTNLFNFNTSYLKTISNFSNEYYSSSNDTINLLFKTIYLITKSFTYNNITTSNILLKENYIFESIYVKLENNIDSINELESNINNNNCTIITNKFTLLNSIIDDENANINFIINKLFDNIDLINITSITRSIDYVFIVDDNKIIYKISNNEITNYGINLIDTLYLNQNNQIWYSNNNNFLIKNLFYDDHFYLLNNTNIYQITYLNNIVDFTFNKNLIIPSYMFFVNNSKYIVGLKNNNKIILDQFNNIARISTTINLSKSEFYYVNNIIYIYDTNKLVNLTNLTCIDLNFIYDDFNIYNIFSFDLQNNNINLIVKNNLEYYLFIIDVFNLKSKKNKIKIIIYDTEPNDIKFINNKFYYIFNDHIKIYDNNFVFIKTINVVPFKKLISRNNLILILYNKKDILDNSYYLDTLNTNDDTINTQSLNTADIIDINYGDQLNLISSNDNFITSIQVGNDVYSITNENIMYNDTIIVNEFNYNFNQEEIYFNESENEFLIIDSEKNRIIKGIYQFYNNKIFFKNISSINILIDCKIFIDQYTKNFNTVLLNYDNKIVYLNNFNLDKIVNGNCSLFNNNNLILLQIDNNNTKLNIGNDSYTFDISLNVNDNNKLYFLNNNYYVLINYNKIVKLLINGNSITNEDYIIGNNSNIPNNINNIYFSNIQNIQSIYNDLLILDNNNLYYNIEDNVIKLNYQNIISIYTENNKLFLLKSDRIENIMDNVNYNFTETVLNMTDFCKNNNNIAIIIGNSQINLYQ